MWDLYDEDKNGTLDKVEACKFLKVMLKEQSGEEPDQAEVEKYFNMMDLDNSGDIDKEEAQKFLKGFELANSLQNILSPKNNQWMQSHIVWSYAQFLKNEISDAPILK